jgi:hypothetical protein
MLKKVFKKNELPTVKLGENATVFGAEAELTPFLDQ